MCMQNTMLFCNKLRKMNAEFEDLVGTIDLFCNSPDTARNIQKYNEEQKQVSSQPSGPKRQKIHPHRQKHEVIPIQLVIAYQPRKNCAIEASSISSILFCNALTTSSLIPGVSMVDFIKKSADFPDTVKKSIDCPAAIKLQNEANGTSAK